MADAFNARREVEAVSAHNAPDGLAEVMGLLGKASFGELRWGWRDDPDAPGLIFHEPGPGHAYAVAMCPRYGKDRWDLDAEAIVAAVNYLRKHGEAIAELVEAAKEVVEDRDEPRFIYGAIDRLDAALAQLSDTGRKPE